MSPFNNNEDLINQIRSYLEKMPVEQRKKLADNAARLIGTTDPEKLKEMLKNQPTNVNPDSLKDTLDKFLKENR